MSNLFGQTTVNYPSTMTIIHSDITPTIDLNKVNQGHLVFADVKKQFANSTKKWEDPDFPANDGSIFVKGRARDSVRIVWKRPSEICTNPQMFVDGPSRMDIKQGNRTDCWLMASISCLAGKQDLFYRVVPKDQTFQKDYAGIFRFRFWQYGSWVEVLIDDRLPVDASTNELVFMSSDSAKNEFWSALLEKAYAKLNGSYQALDMGLTVDALTDLTGGIAVSRILKNPGDTFQMMSRAQDSGALMGADIASSSKPVLANGLVTGHAYSVTEVRTVGTYRLVRVRNPFGGKYEWTGAWSDKSPEWNKLSSSDRDGLRTVKEDGEFWISAEDFASNFTRVNICYLSPSSMDANEAGSTHGPSKWDLKLLEGSFNSRINVPGCPTRNGRFYTNPQYQVTVEDPDAGDSDNTGSIIVGLMQKDRRRLDLSDIPLGYSVYSLSSRNLETNGTNLGKSFFDSNRPVVSTDSPPNYGSREIAGIHKLTPGKYVIIPHVCYGMDNTNYVLRLVSERKGDTLKFIDQKTARFQNQGRVGAIPSDVADGTAASFDDDELKESVWNSLKSRTKGGKMDAYDLIAALNAVFPMSVFRHNGFTIERVRSIVALKDANMSGALEKPELKSLRDDLTACMSMFKTKDVDHRGYLDSCELSSILETLGFQINYATFSTLATRFSDPQGHIRFDDFLHCYIKVKTTFDLFSRMSRSETSNPLWDDFFHLAVYS